MKPTTVVRFAFVVLAGVGCSLRELDVDTDANPCVGTFDGDVTGSGTAPNVSVAGCSVYDGFSGSFSLRLLGPQGTPLINFNGASRPPTGTHAIGAFGTSDPTFGTLHFFTGNTSRNFFSQSGTITVTVSTAGQFKGSLTMTVKENASNPATATVMANFDATCSASGQIIC